MVVGGCHSFYRIWIKLGWLVGARVKTFTVDLFLNWSEVKVTGQDQSLSLMLMYGEYSEGIYYGKTMKFAFQTFQIKSQVLSCSFTASEIQMLQYKFRYVEF